MRGSTGLNHRERGRIDRRCYMRCYMQATQSESLSDLVGVECCHGVTHHTTADASALIVAVDRIRATVPDASTAD